VSQENQGPTANALKGFFVVIAAAIMFVFLFVPSLILEGWVVSWCWEWFVVPLGAPSISVLHGAGLSLLVCLVCPKGSVSAKSADWQRVMTIVFVRCYFSPRRS